MAQYHLTGCELANLLNQVIELYQEYRDVHDRPQEGAQFQAVQDTMEGLDEEWDLCKRGECATAIRVA